MRIKIFGIDSTTISNFILEIISKFIGYRLEKFELDEEFAWKLFYEVQAYIEDNDLDEVLTEERLAELITLVVEKAELSIRYNRLKDPEFVDKLLKEHKYIWDLYLAFKEFVNSDNLKALLDSKMSQELKDRANEKFIKDPTLLDYKVRRDVDRAIDKYEDLTKKEEPSILPVFTDDGEEMRLRAPWVDPDT